MLIRLLLASGAAAAAATSGSGIALHRPIARREKALELDSNAMLRPSSFVQASARTTDSMGRSCPGAVICGEKADNLEWNQACWDCLPDYQEFYCEKMSLTSPSPTYVDICAKEGQYRGAFCKKFAEIVPPEHHENCFFPGSEYKQVYCERMKLKGEFKSNCAADADVGPNYCEGFAVKMKGYIECHGWPGYMMLYCETKQNATVWDATCANHNEVGANYCEDFALGGEIKADCVKYKSYLTLFCDIKATNNASVETCASSEHSAGMYCQELALKKNGFQACWGVAQFDATYCAEISWANPACESMAPTSSIVAP